MIDTRILEKRFAEMGARIKVRFQVVLRPNTARPFIIDVRNDRKGEFFDLQMTGDPELNVISIDPADRHLLLQDQENKDLFLCGHDERHWFVAGIEGRPASVKAAKATLRPEMVQVSLARNRVKNADRDRRRNKGYIRQGEWFFVPAPEIKIDPKLILYKEPLRRGRSKPHICAELCRFGGETVYVGAGFPNGLTQREYNALISRDPDKKKWPWRTMVRNPEAYVRGKIRHPDHKTVLLRGWHRVIPNREAMNGKVAFLD
jgi:hypothetical protein